MRFLTVTFCALLVSFAANVRAEGSNPADKDSDEAIVAAAEKLVGEEALPKKPAVGVKASEDAQADEITQDVKKESEIPVFSKSEKVTKSESSLVWRLLASLGFIAAVGGGLIYSGRRWSRQKNKGGEKARIEIMHQLHLGPKKSIALIRVAGEAVLIGCTDQSINFLKSVTLIDDELDGALQKDFNGFLDDEFSIQDMRTALTKRS